MSRIRKIDDANCTVLKSRAKRKAIDNLDSRPSKIVQTEFPHWNLPLIEQIKCYIMHLSKLS